LVLKEAYPEVTRVVERFGRIHHYVDYKKYRTNKLVTRAGSGEDQVHTSDYSMKLVSKT
jgi:predicted methyltransferase